MPKSVKSQDYLRGLVVGIALSGFSMIAIVVLMSIAFVTTHGWHEFFVTPGNEAPWSWMNKVLLALLATFVLNVILYFVALYRN